MTSNTNRYGGAGLALIVFGVLSVAFSAIYESSTYALIGLGFIRSFV